MKKNKTGMWVAAAACGLLLLASTSCDWLLGWKTIQGLYTIEYFQTGSPNTTHLAVLNFLNSGKVVLTSADDPFIFGGNDASGTWTQDKDELSFNLTAINGGYEFASEWTGKLKTHDADELANGDWTMVRKDLGTLGVTEYTGGWSGQKS